MAASLLRVKTLAGSLLAGASSYYAWKHFSSIDSGLETLSADDERPTSPELNIPSRDDQLAKLQSGGEFDVLVIGGGVTGAGVSLDATLRGLNTACVERYDFSSGTSSRSTKLIHGGVRYLQKAITKLDLEQYRMVKEALHERANLLKIAPHLSYPLPIMLPVYKWWQVPYYWAGIKAYDLVSGKQVLKHSYFLRKSKALEEFPMLKPNKLCGTIVYYDGQHDDARMNLTIALTAIREGAVMANHVEVISLIKDQGVVRGARVRDRISGKEWDIRSKVVVNATGPFCDAVRLMDNPDARKIVQPSAGIHIVLPEYYSPRNMGLLDPSTSDGRVIFFLPWQGRTIAGTTDAPIEVTHLPTPREQDIRFILDEIKSYLSPELSVRRGDVLAAWSGIRPLVMDPNKTDTQSIARNHIIEVSESKLLTISGGKWTTYRSMAEELVNKAVEVGGFSEAKSCLTDGFTLEGGEGWNPNSFIRLVQDYGVDVEVAQRLASTYGDKAPQVAKLATFSGKRWPLVGKRLVDQFPYIEAEVKYAVKEYACTVIDVLARRTRLAFLDVQAAEEAVSKVAEIMAKELKWSSTRRKAEEDRAKFFLGTMGLTVASEVRDVTINLSYQEAKEYAKLFHKFDKDRDGHLSVQDLRKALSEMGEKVSEKDIKELIAEVDIDGNYTIEEEEFLKVMSAIKSGEVANVRLGTIVQQHQQRDRIPVDRSGGGL